MGQKSRKRRLAFFVDCSGAQRGSLQNRKWKSPRRYISPQFIRLVRNPIQTCPRTLPLSREPQQRATEMDLETRDIGCAQQSAKGALARARFQKARRRRHIASDFGQCIRRIPHTRTAVNVAQFALSRDYRTLKTCRAWYCSVIGILVLECADGLSQSSNSIIPGDSSPNGS